MNINKISPLIAATILVISMLACSLGQNPSAGAATPAPQGTTNNPSSASGGCTNPYVPVVAGATWDYKVSGLVSSTFQRSFSSVDAGGFTYQEVFDKDATTSLQVKWNCDNGNLIQLDPTSGNSASLSASGIAANYQTTDSSGVTLPAELKIGDTWIQTATVEGSADANGTKMTTKNIYSNTCKTIGAESITVTAGTFDTMRFECQVVMNVTITMKDNPVQNTMKFNTTNWYAKNIGMVKTVTTGDGFDSAIELTSYKIP